MSARANNPGSTKMPDIRLQALRFAINIETSCVSGGVHIGRLGLTWSKAKSLPGVLTMIFGHDAHAAPVMPPTDVFRQVHPRRRVCGAADRSRKPSALAIDQLDKRDPVSVSILNGSLLKPRYGEKHALLRSCRAHFVMEYLDIVSFRFSAFVLALDED